ncbi:MAG: VOC family protein, partial [Candidatus Microthrix parvicella]|nr:VOC family protein [Candidatus Microthrix parvicella]
METTSFTGISHLDLSVSDVDASATWYERVLDLRRLH